MKSESLWTWQIDSISIIYWQNKTMQQWQYKENRTRNPQIVVNIQCLLPM